ncbi:unnamed protein product [Phaeothamnion confervicola]
MFPPLLRPRRNRLSVVTSFGFLLLSVDETAADALFQECLEHATNSFRIAWGDDHPAAAPGSSGGYSGCESGGGTVVAAACQGPEDVLVRRRLATSLLALQFRASHWRGIRKVSRPVARPHPPGAEITAAAAAMARAAPSYIAMVAAIGTAAAAPSNGGARAATAGAGVPMVADVAAANSTTERRSPDDSPVAAVLHPAMAACGSLLGAGTGTGAGTVTRGFDAATAPAAVAAEWSLGVQNAVNFLVCRYGPVIFMGRAKAGQNSLQQPSQGEMEQAALLAGWCFRCSLEGVEKGGVFLLQWTMSVYLLALACIEYTPERAAAAAFAWTACMVLIRRCPGLLILSPGAPLRAAALEANCGPAVMSRGGAYLGFIEAWNLCIRNSSGNGEVLLPAMPPGAPITREALFDRRIDPFYSLLAAFCLEWSSSATAAAAKPPAPPAVAVPMAVVAATAAAKRVVAAPAAPAVASVVAAPAASTTMPRPPVIAAGSVVVAVSPLPEAVSSASTVGVLRPTWTQLGPVQAGIVPAGQIAQAAPVTPAMPAVEVCDAGDSDSARIVLAVGGSVIVAKTGNDGGYDGEAGAVSAVSRCGFGGSGANDATPFGGERSIGLASTGGAAGRPRNVGSLVAVFCQPVARIDRLGCTANRNRCSCDGSVVSQKVCDAGAVHSAVTAATAAAPPPTPLPPPGQQQSWFPFPAR